MRLPALTVALLAALAAAAPRPAAADKIDAVFDCEGGLVLDVVFDNDADPHVAIVTPRGKDPQTLPIAMSGSGYYYTNGHYGLRGKGDAAMWEIGRMKPIDCTARK